jgi:hypothetical protein
MLALRDALFAPEEMQDRYHDIALFHEGTTRPTSQCTDGAAVVRLFIICWIKAFFKLFLLPMPSEGLVVVRPIHHPIPEHGRMRIALTAMLDSE